MLWQTLVVVNLPALSIADSVRDLLKVNGYKTYDPFPGGLGSPIGKVSRLRMFLAPTAASWVRLLVATDDDVPHNLVTTLAQSLQTPIIWPQLIDDQQFSVGYVTATGEIDATWESLRPYLKDDLSVADLTAAAQQAVVISRQNANLPADVQQMATAHGIEMDQVDKLMGKMTRRLFGKDQEGDALQQAKAGLASQATVDWNTVSGTRLISVMGCLTIPDEYWRLPSWDALTGAYQVARQRQRGQNDLLSTDATALAAVPNALDYTLLYFSKKTS